MDVWGSAGRWKVTGEKQPGERAVPGSPGLRDYQDPSIRRVRGSGDLHCRSGRSGGSSLLARRHLEGCLEDC